MAIRIVLDPGHSPKENAFPPQKGFFEGTQMWRLANFLKVELEKYGFEVFTTRPNLNDNPSLLERGAKAGRSGASLFLSLHSNAPASASDTGPTGSVIYYSTTDKNGKSLADKLGNKVSEIMGHYYRGSFIREASSGVDWYGVIRASAQSGCKAAFILEHGFHTNVKDSAFLIEDANLQKIAVAEAEIIAAHFGQKKQEKIDESKKVKVNILGREVALDGYFKDNVNYIKVNTGKGEEFLPIRNIAESLGLVVGWDAAKKQVTFK